MLDGAAGARADDPHLLAGSQVDLAGVAGGHDVVVVVQVHGLGLAQVTVHPNCATYIDAGVSDWILSIIDGCLNSAAITIVCKY